MHHAIYIVALLLLAGSAFFLPYGMGIAAIGVGLVTAVWLYFSLRGERATPRHSTVSRHDDGAGFVGSTVAAPDGPANVCADVGHGGLGCGAGGGSASHD